MEGVIKDSNAIAKAARNAGAFNDAMGVYLGANPLTMASNIQALLKAIDASTESFYDKAKGLPPGGMNILRGEIVRERAMENVKKMGEDVKGGIKNIIAKDIAENKTIGDIKKDIARYTETVSESRAATIARTETAYARSQGNLARAYELGQKYFIVQISGSEVMCDECMAAYDGKVFTVPDDIDELPPRHPNCECEEVFFTEQNMAEESAADSSIEPK
jgi:SPP1 gp7 family putative phage head morphogenesis protein